MNDVPLADELKTVITAALVRAGMVLADNDDIQEAKDKEN
jgi:hypothetical protein